MRHVRNNWRSHVDSATIIRDPEYPPLILLIGTCLESPSPSVKRPTGVLWQVRKRSEASSISRMNGKVKDCSFTMYNISATIGIIVKMYLPITKGFLAFQKYITARCPRVIPEACTITPIVTDFKVKPLGSVIKCLISPK